MKMSKMDEIMKTIYAWDRELSQVEQDLPVAQRKTAAARKDLFERLEQVLELESDGPEL